MNKLKGIVDTEKHRLRKIYKEKRANLFGSIIKNNLEQLQIISKCEENLIEIFKLKNFKNDEELSKNFNFYSVISSYYPINDELNSLEICLKLKEKFPKLRIVLPIIKPNSRLLEFREYTSEEKLKLGKFNLKEPIESCELISPMIVLTPFLSFDMNKTRLGYGMGYYDNTLQQLYDNK